MASTARIGRTISERNAIGDIDLAPGEKILFVTSRHWIVLIQRIMIPLICAAICGAIAAYRAIGGVFLLDNADISGEIDLVNTLLALAFGAILLTWVLGRRRIKLNLSRQLIMLLSAGVIATLFWFRYQGGRLFEVNRFYATPFDGLNIVLFSLVIIFLLLCVYVFFDWTNDQLVITNLRVIIDDEVLLVRHVQEQLFIDDIQNVTASTNTYPQHWLKYGTIVIRSANADRKMVFAGANQPLETQAKINAEVRKLRGQQSADSFRSMVEQKVYNVKPPSTRPAPRVVEKPMPLLLRWVLDANPKISSEKGTITWRPHWIFLVQKLAQPIGTLFLALFLLILSSRLGILTGGWFVLVSILIVGICVFWMVWEVEDYRNDAYILEPDKLIDVQKKPFGPEDRRTAALGSLQNVNFKVTFWSGIFGFGNVLAETAGSGGAFTFPHVPNAPDVAATINDYLAEYKKGEKERSLNDTLTLLQHYHEAQKRRREIREAAANPPAAPAAPAVANGPTAPPDAETLVVPTVSADSASPDATTKVSPSTPVSHVPSTSPDATTVQMEAVQQAKPNPPEAAQTQQASSQAQEAAQAQQAPSQAQDDSQAQPKKSNSP